MAASRHEHGTGEDGPNRNQADAVERGRLGLGRRHGGGHLDYHSDTFIVIRRTKALARRVDARRNQIIGGHDK